MPKTLIVNADDCNLTPGVTRAILDCHDHGILSSTTWIVNLPHDEKTVKALKARKRLGVGIHLNLTLGRPVSPEAAVASLLAEDGCFRKAGIQLEHLPRPAEVRAEYGAQIEKFKKIFGRLPTHLDTHHQIHDHPFYLVIASELANERNLPLRRSRLLVEKASYDFHFTTADFLFGDLRPEGHWHKAQLEETLKALPEGISEIMCHPGENDAALKAISSFTAGREEEWQLFRAGHWRAFLARCGITLAHYGLCTP